MWQWPQVLSKYLAQKQRENHKTFFRVAGHWVETNPGPPESETRILTTSREFSTRSATVSFSRTRFLATGGKTFHTRRDRKDGISDSEQPHLPSPVRILFLVALFSLRNLIFAFNHKKLLILSWATFSSAHSFFITPLPKPSFLLPNAVKTFGKGKGCDLEPTDKCRLPF